MNYQKIHDTIIQKAKLRNWTWKDWKHKNKSGLIIERHHIIPKCLNGSNKKENLVYLTAKEHFIIHILLTKMFPNNSKATKSMVAAYLYMAGIAFVKKGMVEKRTSRLYESYRQQISQMLSGSGNPQYGKNISDEHKEAIRIANTGKIVSMETRELMRQNGLKRKQTQITKDKISHKQKIKWQLRPKEERERLREMARNNATGRPQGDNQKKLVSQALQKQWKLYPPNGEPFIIINLLKYCKENGLDQGNMTNVAKGRLRHYKGWKCELLGNVVENQL